MRQIELAPNGREKIVVKLIGEDGNAFSILGRVSRAMQRAGWPTEDIGEFMKVARAGDYNHLLAVVMDYTEDAEDEDDDM